MIRPTVARVLKALRNEGLITVNGTRGVFVAKRFPHHSRYFWVSSEQPGSIEWTSFLATILELIENGETGIDGDVIPLVGVDGRSNNPEYQTLCEAVEHGSAAGLFVMNSATTYLLPCLQAPGLPRVAIWAPLPHAGLLSLDFNALIERAWFSALRNALGARRDHEKVLELDPKDLDAKLIAARQQLRDLEKRKSEAMAKGRWDKA